MKFEDKFYPSILQHSLQDFRTNGLFCDVKLVVDGQEFQAHKLILSAASPYFRVMFNTESPFIESNQEKIDLHGVDRSAISDILKFMYSSNIDINENNVFILMEAANLFQIYALKTFISFYLQSSLTLENCLQFYIMASRHHYHDLATCALHFLLVNFSKIVENDEFLDLPFEILLEIISSKLLNIRNEENLLEIIMKWIQDDTNSRLKYLEPLVSKINLNLLSLEGLKKIKNDLFMTAGLVQKIDEIITYKTAKGLKMHVIDLGETISYHNVRHEAERAVIFAIGGESSGIASQSVECFTLGFDKWKYIVPDYIVKRHETKYTRVLPPLRCARYYAASAYDAYNVYVIGGKNSTTLLDECEIFNVRTNQWNYFLQLPQKLFACGAALLEGELMVVGGCGEEGLSDKVWKLDKAHKKWKLILPLNFPRYFHGTVAVGGYLYVIGGYGSKLKTALNSCFKFDPGSNKWLKVSAMHEARAKFGCAAVDSFIYVFGGTSDECSCLKSVERYNIFTDEWTYESPMTIARHSFSVAVSDREIYCMGGSDCTHFLDTVEKFSLRTKRWHCVHSLQISRLAPSAAALLVPYRSRELTDNF